MSMRIAFASTNGDYVDQHFGSARYFQIFEVEGESSKLVETRTAQPQCQGSCEGGFEGLLQTLADCDAVFVLKIGQGAAAYMISHGKRVFEAYGLVDEILQQLAASNLLEQG
ncbi:MAG: NifB/NifX family molybdenum-iron cluster-binding protein [Oscillospiraceae bacterium]